MRIFKKHRSLWSLLFVFLFVSFTCLTISSVQKESLAQEKGSSPAIQLSTADCIKCHSSVQGMVESKGAKHKTAVTCMQCHKGHPPMVSKEKIIPLCSECHAGQAALGDRRLQYLSCRPTCASGHEIICKPYSALPVLP